MIARLPPSEPVPPRTGEGAGPDHPMRVVTRQVAFEPGGWTPERRTKVAALFDSLAPEWHTRGVAGREEPVVDALQRGVPAAGADLGPRCLEVGSGIGLSTAALTERFPLVVALDLSLPMLRLAPAAPAPRLQGDAAALPVAPASAEAVVLVNALLFPAEVDRVLAPAGVVIWVNTSGDRTPIHLPVTDVAAALPGSWDGAESVAGHGTWGVLRRAT